MLNIAKELNALSDKIVHWHKITREGLDADYTVLLPSHIAQSLLNILEDTLEYEDPENTKVKLFGKWYKIPRLQVAYGDSGTTYRFSGNTTAAKSWIPELEAVRDHIYNVTGHYFNFVLINRYSNGLDHMGQHRDNEPDLDPLAPIASLSLGQNRPFVFKHKDTRKRGSDKRNIPPVKMMLENGSLLMMNPPTNKIWYHGLPQKKSANGIRINLTFRCIKIKKNK